MMFALAAETVGLIGVCITAAASIVAAYLTHRTRRENSSQHGTSQALQVQSQRLLSDLHSEVKSTGNKVDRVASRLDSVAERVDNAHIRIDNHKPRRWFR